MLGRRIVVHDDDVLMVGSLALDGEVLKAIVNPKKRLLWYFMRNENGDVQPVALDETKVIWLTDNDCERSEILNAV